jgi:hypothetical protein
LCVGNVVFREFCSTNHVAVEDEIARAIASDKPRGKNSQVLNRTGAGEEKRRLVDSTTVHTIVLASGRDKRASDPVTLENTRYEKDRQSTF